MPALLLLLDFARDGLGTNPIEEVTHRTGKTTIVLLGLTLAVTPFRRFTGWNSAIRLRRMLGLFTFFYATLHFLTWLGLDLFFDWSLIGGDILDRPYITVGFTALLLLLPLAVTSTTGWIRRLGGRRWQLLHRLVYLVALLALVHFFWSQKKDVSEPTIFATAFGALLLARLLPVPRRRAGTRPAVAPIILEE
ncbi:MAG TPA: protein-methionine-sulfoxide reductase heme-binding subunit MsrQ [Gemmatimonadales bacterium]|nr:protein-methionine-sulfoxide reductase heme-binding subunit MsrQ [Gemmatimonadales bacterium]